MKNEDSKKIRNILEDHILKTHFWTVKLTKEQGVCEDEAAWGAVYTYPEKDTAASGYPPRTWTVAVSPCRDPVVTQVGA